MSYDLYVECPQGDQAIQLQLLVTQPTQQALNGYLLLVHGRLDKQKKQLTRGELNGLISKELQRLQSLGLRPPQPPSMGALPPGSWFLQFTFTLAKPWISKDDDPFYVTESVNPVRKDKVFKVPMMSAASWKGLLRWTVMHTRLVKQKDALTPPDFAAERFRQTLLFGDEKGEEPGQTKDFAAYLDALKPEARAEYERLLREHYQVKADEPLPHHSGRLNFYPTFFNLIDVEVINPHSRRTKAGTHPIYLECVPADAQGTFSLLYVPFDRVGKEQQETATQVAEDLPLLAEGLRAMFTAYGFSAKRTSGFGLARETMGGGTLTLRIAGLQVAAPPPPEMPPAPAQALPRYLEAPGRLKPEYLTPDGRFRERSEAELKAMKKADRQLYDKAKAWWEREGKALAEQRPQPELAIVVPPPAPAPAWPSWKFASFDALVALANQVAQQLTKGGAP